MKRAIILALIAAAGYLGYQNYGAIMAKVGFHKSGGASQIILFTTDACGAPCGETAGDIRLRFFGVSLRSPGKKAPNYGAIMMLDLI